MKKYLIVKGCAGLGNRLITLSKAIQYAQKTQRQLYVDWTDGMFADPGTNAFYRYFQLSSDIEHTQQPDLILEALSQGATTYPRDITPSDILDNVYDHWHVVGTPLATHLPPYRILISQLIHGKASSLFGLQAWQRNEDPQTGYLHNIRNIYSEHNYTFGSQLTRSNSRDIVIFTDFRPLVSLNNIFRHISLKPQYQSQYRNFAHEHHLTEQGIGLHIRATDKKPHRQLQQLLQHLDHKLQDNPQTVIYLSTDNADIANQLTERYPQRLIQYPKYLPTNLNGRGIHQWALYEEGFDKATMFEEALADMWILSMCHELYWQGNSSFSQISTILKADKKNIHDWLRL